MSTPQRRPRPVADTELERKAAQIRWFALIGAGIIGLLVLLVWNASKDSTSSGGEGVIGIGGGAAEPESPLEPAMHAFLAHWNANERTEALAMIAKDQQGRLGRLLRKVFKRRGWTETLPQATQSDREDFGSSRAYYWAEIAEYGRMRISWEWEDRWVITRFKFEKKK